MSTSLPSFYKKCFYESNAKIMSQQSGDYTVYTYIDGELMEVEHLCSMDS